MSQACDYASMAPMIRRYADTDHDAVYDICVVSENTPALAFHRRLGFRAIDVGDPGPVVYLGLTL